MDPPQKIPRQRLSRTTSSKYGAISDENKRQLEENSSTSQQDINGQSHSSGSQQEEDTSSDEQSPHHLLEHELTLKDIQDVTIFYILSSEKKRQGLTQAFHTVGYEQAAPVWFTSLETCLIQKVSFSCSKSK